MARESEVQRSGVPLPTIGDVQRAFVERHLSHRLMVNVLRGLYVETMVELLLQPDWKYVGRSYGEWDFEGPDGIRLEVKQTAYRQSWTGSKEFRNRNSFSIQRKKKIYDKELGKRQAVREPFRPAQAYLFARHPIFAREADHRNPGEWEFAAVPEQELPRSSDSIAESIVERRWGFVAPGEIKDRLEEVAGLLSKEAS